MKLVLENFICFNKYLFETPNDDGLILIKGDSGAGKTTILKAILYALWGKLPTQGKVNTFGAKRAYVRFEYSNLIIERWTGPKQLQLTVKKDGNAENFVLKDVEAQNHIKEVIGFGEEIFEYSSWVPQKSSSSILTETPAKQLEIIRTISIGACSYTLIAMKQHIKQTITSLSRDLERKRGKIELQSDELEKLHHVEVPEITKEQLQLEIKSLGRLKERCSTLEYSMLNFKEKIGVMRERAIRTSKLKSQISSLKIDTRDISEILRKIYQKMWEDSKMIVVKAKTEKAKKDIEYYSHIKWINEINNNFENITIELESCDEIASSADIKQNIGQTQSKRSHIETELKNEKNKHYAIQLWNNFIQRAKKYINPKWKLPSKIRTKLVNFDVKNKEEIKNYSRILEQDRNSDYLKCPECGKDLKLTKKGMLQKAKPLTDKEKSSNEKKICIYSEHIALVDELLSHQVWLIKDLDEIIVSPVDTTLEEIEDCINKLQSKKERLEAKLQNLILEQARHKDTKQKIDKLRIELDRLVNERKREVYMKWEGWKTTFDSLKDAIEFKDKQEKRVSLQYTLQKEYDMKNSLHINKRSIITESKKELEELGKGVTLKTTDSDSDTDTSSDSIINVDASTDLQSLDYCEKRYKEIATDNKSTRTRYEKLRIRFDKISDKYVEFDLYVNISTRLKETVERGSNEIKELEKDIREWEILKEYVKSSENDAIEATLMLFNRCISEFLSLMFTEDNMIPTVCIELGEKKIKTKYWYQDNEYSNIREFSGGEMDRLLLASILTWNSIFESKFLLLDESLSSLDATNNTNILIALRDTFQRLNIRKLILVSSHEALTGVFNHIHYIDTNREGIITK